MSRQIRSQVGGLVCGATGDPDLSSPFVGKENWGQQEGKDLNWGPRTWKAVTPSQILSFFIPRIQHCTLSTEESVGVSSRRYPGTVHSGY